MPGFQGCRNKDCHTRLRQQQEADPAQHWAVQGGFQGPESRGHHWILRQGTVQHELRNARDPTHAAAGAITISGNNNSTNIASLLLKMSRFCRFANIDLPRKQKKIQMHFFYPAKHYPGLETQLPPINEFYAVQKRRPT